MQTLTFSHRGREVRFPDTRGRQARFHTKGSFYESKMLDAIADARWNGVYVDVGANIGNHSVYFEMFCPATKVIAFEPLPRTFQILEQVRELNDLSFEAHQLGLGKHPEHVHHTMEGRDYEFDVRTLDSFELTDVAVIKIDIEGMEVPALEGMVETLRTSRPVLFIEAHTDDDIAAQAGVLDQLGYSRTGRVFNASPTYEWTAR